MKKRTNNLVRLLIFYILAVELTMLVCCYFIYQQQKTKVVSSMDLMLQRIESEYESIVCNFWDLYLPIFESDSSVTVKQYFAREQDLSPYHLMEIKVVMQHIAQRDNRIRWVVFYSPDRTKNYIFHPENNALQALPDDFPYLASLQAKHSTFEIYGEDADNELVLAGGSPSHGNGSILIAYDTTPLHKLAENNLDLSGLHFAITWRGTPLIAGDNARIPAEEVLVSGSHMVSTIQGSSYFISVSDQHPQGSYIFYTVPNRELCLRAHRFTPVCLIIVSFFLLISLLAYFYSMKIIRHEVFLLRDGLHRLGENRLDYRITDEFQQRDFSEIAGSINAMAQSLKENIDRVQEYQKKQREAEIQELQAKFNPHFLYNSLDMFRARCYENGDEETADLIADTASIFRGFITRRTFIPLREELAFSRRYLSLFRARYGDSIQILYDMDPAIMDYGIIRNVFQPIIENYFVHGIDSTRTDNILRFCGHILDEQRMRITVEDNGFGMSPEALAELNAHLQEPINNEKESYGLKNLSQRIRLFYGTGCGLVLRSNPSGGLIIQMDVARWTCDKVEQESISP